MMITWPFSIFLSSTALSMSSSESKQMALPLNAKPSLPVILATDPSGARLPLRMCRCPVSLMGLSSGMMTSWPSLSPGRSARFSAIVLPVTVRHEPSIILLSSKNFMTAGVPPTLWRSSMTYLPEGLRSARKGVLDEILCTSSIVMSMSIALAMAMRCSTALVEPPSTVMKTIAFSNAALVMMSEGLMSFSRSNLIALPACTHSKCFWSVSAGVEPEYGSDMPSISIAEAIVLAVYIPPQAPAPGHDFSTIVSR